MSTNHSALKHLLEKKNAKPHLIRWILLLQEFDIEIKDKARAENEVVHHISRPVVMMQDLLIDDAFPEDHLLAVALGVAPRFADIDNYLACGVLPLDLTNC